MARIQLLSNMIRSLTRNKSRNQLPPGLIVAIPSGPTPQEPCFRPLYCRNPARADSPKTQALSVEVIEEDAPFE